MDATGLPVEIWTNIVHQLSETDKRRCLYVSRLFRAISVQFLFRAIIVYLIADYEDVFAPDEITRITVKSWELLDRISSDFQFAKLVKRMTVFTCGGGEMIFEMRSLNKSLKAIPYLQSFSWYRLNESLELPPEISETLYSYVPGLEELNMTTPSPELKELTNLKRLSCFPLVGEPVDHETISKMIDSNIITLHDLVIPGRIELPIRVLTGLASLELHDFDFGSLPLVFRHATRLESLALEGDACTFLFQVLNDYSSALPRLSTFKLLSTEMLDEIEYSALYAFLRGRPSLCRVDLDIMITWDGIRKLLPAIRNVEALGLEIAGNFTRDDITFLAEHLCKKTTALRLSFNSIISVDGVSLSPLMNKLTELPSLRFFYIGALNLVIDLEDILSAKQVDTIGIDDKIWSVERVEDGTPNLYGWPSWKMVNRIIECFSYDDGAWLMQHYSTG